MQALALDLDSDGDLDVAVRCNQVITTKITKGVPMLWLLENDKGVLKPRQAIPLPPNATSIRYEDQIYQIAPGQLDMRTADVNGDGRMDLIQVYTPPSAPTSVLRILIQNGDFSFEEHQQILPFVAERLCVGQIDNARGPDLVIGETTLNPAYSSKPFVHVFLHDGGATFTEQSRLATEDIPPLTSGISMLDCSIADLDADGQADLVVSNQFASYSAVVLWNEGHGQFAPFERIFGGAGKLAIADMDGDGRSDVVTTDHGQTIAVLRNQGNRTLVAHEWAIPGLIPEEVVNGAIVADVDGDGRPDVAVMDFGRLPGDFLGGVTINTPADHWILLKNNLHPGGGDLTYAAMFPAGGSIFDLIFADLGSGQPDVLAVALNDDRISVNYNYEGRYAVSESYDAVDPRSPDGSKPFDLVSGDFKGDGSVQLAMLETTDYSANQAYLVPNTVALFDAALTPPRFFDLIGVAPQRLLAGDIDGAGSDDIAVIIRGQTLFVPQAVACALGGQGGALGPFRYLQVAAAGFDVGGSPLGLALLDENSTGRRSLALGWTQQGTEMLDEISVTPEGQPYGPLQRIDTLSSNTVFDNTFFAPLVLQSADLNADGLTDLIAASYAYTLGISGTSVSTNLRVYRRTPAGSFARVWEQNLPSRVVTDVVIADVNHDSLPDVVVASVPSREDVSGFFGLDVFANVAGVPANSPSSYGVGISDGAGTGTATYRSQLRLTTMDIDGKAGPDIIVSNYENNEVTVLLNDGAGSFPTQERYLTGGSPRAVLAVDLDKDGHSELAVANDAKFLLSGFHQGTLSILRRFE